MKWRYKAKFVWGYLRQHKFRNLMMIVLILVCFLLIGTALMYAGEVRYCEASADKVLRHGITGTGIITVDIENGADNEKMTAFLEALSKETVIYAAGNWSYGASASAWTKTLEQVQGGHKYYIDSDTAGNENMLEIIGTNPQALELFHMQVKEGTKAENLTIDSEDTYMLYLGAGYQDIAVGTVFENQVGEKTIKYQVAGILKNNQKLLIPHIEQVSEYTKTAVYPSDYAVIMVAEEGLFDNNILFSYHKKQGKQARRKIMELTEDYGFRCEITELEDLFQDIRRANRERIYVIGEVSVIILFIIAVLINSRQIVYYLDRKREYGILYALGADSKDLIYIVICETIAVFITALAGSMIVLFLFYATPFWTGEMDELTWQVEKNIILLNVYPVYIVLTLINAVMSEVWVICMIRKKVPAQLMRREN